MDRWNDYQRRFAPLTARYANLVQRGPAQHGQAARGKAETARVSAGQQMPDLSSNMFATGATPGSGRFNAAAGQMYGNTAQAAGLGAVQGRLESERQNLAGIQNVAGIGQKQAQSALSGLSNNASRAADEERRYAIYDQSIQDAKQQQAGMQLGMQAARNLYGGEN